VEKKLSAAIKKFQLWILFAVALAFASLAQAEIDVKTGAFLDTWMDLDVQSPGFHLAVERTYSSRSNYDGLFGFGWCSNLETRLKRDQDQIEVTECGGGVQTLFSADGGSRNSTRTFTTLRLPSEKLTFDDERYIWSRVNGRNLTFNKNGTLFSISEPGGTYNKLTYNPDNSLASVQNKNGERIDFKYTHQKHVASITGPKKILVQYQYAGSKLAAVKNAWGNKYVYEYDQWQNLTAIIYPDKTADKISYDTKRDWATGFRSRFGCSETLSYSLKSSEDRHEVSVTKICPGQAVAETTLFTVWGAAKKIAAPVRTEKKVERGIASYSGYLDNGVRIAKTGNGYFEDLLESGPNGQIQSRTIGSRRFEYGVFKDRQPVSAIVEAPGIEQFGLSKSKYQYRYDNRGKLLAVVESGRKTNLRYDKEGRLASAVSTKGLELAFEYKTNSSKPVRLIQKGLGSVYLDYGPDDTVIRVRSELSQDKQMSLLESYRRLRLLLEPVTSLSEI
jgi:YD repeat-containing protein